MFPLHLSPCSLHFHRIAPLVGYATTLEHSGAYPGMGWVAYHAHVLMRFKFDHKKRNALLKCMLHVYLGVVKTIGLNNVGKVQLTSKFLLPSVPVAVVRIMLAVGQLFSRYKAYSN